MPRTKHRGPRHKRYKLGDTWTCKCGARHKLSGGYLAAHWYLSLDFTCPQCERRYNMKAGLIEETT